MDFEKNIFGKVTFSSLLKEIYDNSRKTEKQISELITQIHPFIKTAGDAIMLVPLIKEYLDVKVKNDEHLIKMAAIVQRGMVNSNGDSDFLLSEKEQEDLYKLAQDMNSKSLPTPPKEVN
jgi:hypothetical protein